MPMSTPMNAEAMRPKAAPADRQRYAFAGLVLIAILVAYLPTLIELGTYWFDHSEYSHGFFMPVIAAWLLWERRDRFRDLQPTTSWLGLALLAASLVLLVLGEMKLSWFLKPYAFVASLVALVWTFFGWRTVRAALPGIIALVLMCPLPGRVQNALTLPLKNTAATLATGLLDLSGVAATLEGNQILLPGVDDLWVADACSGISSLISLVSVAIIACMLWPVAWWVRLLVVVSAIPIAVVLNGVRIWGTGLLSIQYGREAAQGFFHFFEGFVMFGLGALLLLAWAWLLGQLAERKGAA